MKKTILALSALLTITSHAQVVSGNWDYTWDGNLNGNNNGGTWTDVEMSMQTSLINTNTNTIGGVPLYNWVSNDSFSLKTSLVGGGTQELFAVVTNDAAAPTTTSANWTALYFDKNGTVHAGTYSNSPLSSHSFTPFLTASYLRTVDISTGTVTFDLSLDQSQLAALNSGPPGAGAGWEGFGYPFDNDGQTAGNAATPYRMGIWMRSYGKGALGVGVNPDGSVDWKILDPNSVGTFDDNEDFTDGPTIVPEPSSSLLSLVGITGLLFRRKRG